MARICLTTGRRRWTSLRVQRFSKIRRRKQFSVDILSSFFESPGKLSGGVMRKLSMLLLIALIQVQAQTRPPAQKGGQEMFGSYDIVKGWPKDISIMPGNEKWTYGAAQSVFAESP